MVLGKLAVSAHGVVTHSQLVGADVTVAEIKHRLRTGALIREYPGVYRVGHRAPSVEARYLAAVLACGEGALLSGRAAAHLLAVLKGPAPPPEVTAPTERRVRGVRTHRARNMDPRDATTWHGIPVTTVPRTLVDIAADVTADQLARACHEAGVRHRTTPAQVEAVLARRPNTPGAGKLRAVMRGDVRVTLSKLEARFLELLRQAGFPYPAPTGPQAPGGSTAAGPPSASRSSSTATATTPPATPGSRTAAANARHTHAATTCAGTRTATSSRAPGSCWAS